jgi:hypothetical protein
MKKQNTHFKFCEHFSKAMIFTLAFCLSFGLISCDKEKTGSAAEKKFAIEKKYDRGPLTLNLKVSKEQITTADQLTLQLEAVVGADYYVEFNKPGEKLEEFKVVDHDEPMPTMTKDGKVLHVQSYQLEPFLAGDYKIPPMKITFWKKSDKQPEKHECETESLTIRVTSLLSGKSDEAKIKDLVPPMGIPGWDRKWLWIVATGIAIVAMCFAGTWMYRRHRNSETADEIVKLPAHEIAYRQIDVLLADALIEKGQIKDFYFRISDILRRYIENRFSLRAPERTTEEFLFELRQSSILADSHKRLLKDFLSQCDLVKFAKFLPATDEAQKTVEVSRHFIDETKQKENEETAQS